MRIKSIELNNFKRFTHLTVDSIPETAKLVVLVGPNGSGKTSFMEAMNHFYKYSGYQDIGDFHYLSKIGNSINYEHSEWYNLASKMVNIHFHDLEFANKIGRGDVKGHFYFRSAYRNEPDFQIQAMQKQNDPTQSVRLSTLIQNDQTVSSNYQRLIANTISGVYDTSNDTKSVATLRDELIGKIRMAISRVFEDLEFSSVGEPLINGNFYFTKGTTKDFSYQNLSAGEKAAFDLILDMVVQSKYYPDAIYCIDEPELHMHTKLQGKVLRELYLLIPGSSQLWVSTHSIGMLQEAEDIEKENPGTVVFLDFGNRDFDTDQIIRPSRIGKAVINKFYELAFGDFAKLMLPKTIVFCEGDPNGGKRKVIKIVDRDDRSSQEVADLAKAGIKVLKRRNLESYVLDDAVIKKLCDKVGKPEEYVACIQEKQKALTDSVSRGNAPDDFKKASGGIYISLKRRLSLTQCGNNPDPFMRDTLAPLITPDMDVYKELEAEIFGDDNDDNNGGTTNG